MLGAGLEAVVHGDVAQHQTGVPEPEVGIKNLPAAGAGDVEGQAAAEADEGIGPMDIDGVGHGFGWWGKRLWGVSRHLCLEANLSR